MIIHNDEPTTSDKLNRTQYAVAFARLAETSETPLVIGLYGEWGVGKTSLMKLVEKNLKSDKAKSIWFDPWQHQFDENPALALLHTIVDKYEMKEEGKKLLAVIATAFGSTLLKATTTLNAKDVDELGKRFEEERFLVRDARVRLQEHFTKLIKKAQNINSDKEQRIIFFIDDLDRCSPSNILRLLEALKMYLNIPGCVYFLGVDRHALEQSIRMNYKEVDVSATKYLEKIVQLPFLIPLIAPEHIDNYVKDLLPSELNNCAQLLILGLEGNPRQIKMFVNMLMLNHRFASLLNIPKYNPKILVLLLIIQYWNPRLYLKVTQKPDMLLKLKKGGKEVKSLLEEYTINNDLLIKLLSAVDISRATDFGPYIYLTNTVSMSSLARETNMILSTLTPREEKILRMRFGISPMVNEFEKDIRIADAESKLAETILKSHVLRKKADKNK